MGFSIYWNQLPVSQAVWDTFVHRALKLVKRRRTGTIMLENKYAQPTQKNVLSFKGSEGESHETFYVSKDFKHYADRNMDGFGSCKTARKPYTMDVYICLILMFDLGMIRSFSSDDMNEQYPEALKYVKTHYALNRSYEKLKNMGLYEDDDGKSVKTASPLSQRPRKQTAKKAKKARRVKSRRAKMSL